MIYVASCVAWIDQGGFFCLLMGYSHFSWHGNFHSTTRLIVEPEASEGALSRVGVDLPGGCVMLDV